MASIVGSNTHISTATTTNIKASILKKIVINTLVASSSITVNDGVGGTAIAVITVGATAPTAWPVTIQYDCPVATGTLSIVTVGTNDLTVIVE